MNSKHCPYCNCSTKVVKIGTTSSGRQRYQCKLCKKTWTSSPRPGRIAKKIWNDYVWDNMPVRALAGRYRMHENTIRRILNTYQPEPLDLDNLPEETKAAIMVIALDTTYFGRRGGVVTIVDAHTGKLLYFHEIKGAESNTEYYIGICKLKTAGIRPKACVIDSRTGLAELLNEEGMLVQLCHFHMWQIVRRYLTNNPVLGPNIELKAIIDSFLSKHTQTTRYTFAAQMNDWILRNQVWLGERHRNEHGKLEYSHEETRRAYRAIKNHFPWLFTYEKYPELNVPKTSNIIEGKFGNAKDKLRLHHGYTHELKIKIFFSLLSGR